MAARQARHSAAVRRRAYRGAGAGFKADGGGTPSLREASSGLPIGVIWVI
jgi:hypothetical protein